MKILVCNPGSTSLKFRLSEEPEGKVIAGGKIGRVGSEKAEYDFSMGEKKASGICPVLNYVEGIRLFLAFIGGAEQADAVAFKTVLAKGVSGVAEITESVKDAMRAYLAAAPVHNTAYLAAIEAFETIAPGKKLIGCFETAFHETIPLERALYSVSYEWYEKYGIRRMGFHGASHEGVSEATKGYQKVISCHLGGSGSICAIEDGKSVDTSFGFSLQAGLPHVDRCGDIDPYIEHFLLTEGMSEAEFMRGIEKQGGLKGISGLSGDMRDLREAAKGGNERAKLAIGVYVTQIVRYIGAFAAELHGIDALAFTGGIGENDFETRREVCENLGYLGVFLDEDANRMSRPRIEKAGSVPVFVVKADEEATVARKAWKFLALTEKLCYNKLLRGKNMTPLAVVAGIVERGGETLVCRRPAKSNQGLLWEFPGGKIEKGESPEEALTRELKEELGIDVSVTSIYDARITEYPEKTVLILFYKAKIEKGEPVPIEEDAVKWVSGKEALTLPFTPADRPVAEKLFG